ncbi:MAG TPA: coproporphyrinogen III oxidase, partial [Kiritimatiellia bacterium]|nr:coproporphyrinogen III oxidase [Kiritimatiellia bacterium]
GPAAASRIGRSRWTNSEDLEEYINALSRDSVPPGERDTLGAAEDAAERALFALRLHEGVDLAADALRFPALSAQAELWERRLDELAAQGITERGGRRWRLTARGREVCDAVLRELV